MGLSTSSQLPNGAEFLFGKSPGPPHMTSTLTIETRMQTT